jgi:hypothetical protein
MSTSTPTATLSAATEAAQRDYLPAEQIFWPTHRSKRVAMAGFGIGILGIAATLAGIAGQPVQAYASYLFAFMLFLGLGLGALFFVLIHHITGSRWGVAVRRVAEGIMGTLPLFAILFVPIVFGMGHLFEWSRPEVLEVDALTASKTAYLNVPFFLIRAVIYFAVWAGLSVYMAKSSLRQDKGDGVNILAKMRGATAPALILYGLTVTFAAFDWLMSLSPHWFSTIFGVYYFAGAFQGFLALMIVVGLLLQRGGLLQGVVTVEHYHDLGKLLFGFTVFFAYIAFCQYFLIWYANIPEETFWFTDRWGQWSGVSVSLIFFTVVLPFVVLLGRQAKRNSAPLLVGALLVLVGRVIDMYWLVMPSLKVGPAFHWTSIAALVGIGGLFVGTLAWRLGKGALVPVGDPYLRRSLGHENV